MLKRRWEAIPNHGQAVLEGLARDASDFKDVAGDFGPLTDVARELEVEADRIGGLVVGTALAGGDLEDLGRLAESLEEPERLSIVQAYLARHALDRLVALKKGREYDGSDSIDSQLALMAGRERRKPSKRAEVTALKSGVLLSKRFSRSSIPEPGEFRSQMQLDTLIEGKLVYLGSEPEEGGRLVLGRPTHFVHLLGLVNPVNGEPRVSLEIFLRNA